MEKERIGINYNDNSTAKKFLCYVLLFGSSLKCSVM